MVVEENPERQAELCKLLTTHGLAPHPVAPTDLALETQGWLSVILVSGDNSWELAGRLRTFNENVPIVLMGAPCADESQHRPLVQACLPSNVTAQALVDEVERWTKRMALRHPSKRVGQILLVDDDDKLRRILQNYLELKGFAVTTASSGEEARLRLAEQTPRAVLLDVKMPGMDGLMTLKHIRVSHPNLPVIFISNSDEDETMEEAAILGANDFLIKPFNFEHLETVLLTTILDQ
jgi:CheY-like chemotaxis protein